MTRESMVEPVAKNRESGVMAVVYPSLYWVVYAVGWILKTIAFTVLRLLHLLYRPVAFTLQPVVYLTQFLLACLALPFKAVVKFEVHLSSLINLLWPISLMTSRRSSYTCPSPPS